jgi:hypothetical protein
MALLIALAYVRFALHLSHVFGNDVIQVFIGAKRNFFAVFKVTNTSCRSFTIKRARAKTCIYGTVLV